jgi:hypothetical protein
MYLNAVTGLMDPHTDYFAPVEKRSFSRIYEWYILWHRCTINAG